jgi:hypothetical protein
MNRYLRDNERRIIRAWDEACRLAARIDAIERGDLCGACAASTTVCKGCRAAAAERVAIKRASRKV